VTYIYSCADPCAAAILSLGKTAKRTGTGGRLGLLRNNRAYGLVRVATPDLGTAPNSIDDVDSLNFMKRFQQPAYRIFRWVFEKYGHHWESRWEKNGKLNPHAALFSGTSLAAPAAHRFECPLRNEEKTPKSAMLWPACAGGWAGRRDADKKYHIRISR